VANGCDTAGYRIAASQSRCFTADAAQACWVMSTKTRGFVISAVRDVSMTCAPNRWLLPRSRWVSSVSVGPVSESVAA